MNACLNIKSKKGGVLQTVCITSNKPCQKQINETQMKRKINYDSAEDFRDHVYSSYRLTC